jgi:hypothetical protein
LSRDAADSQIGAISAPVVVEVTINGEGNMYD